MPLDTSGHRARGLGAGVSTCARSTTTGQLHCWGKSSTGQLGLGQTDPFGDSAGETSVGAVALRGRVAPSGGHRPGANTCAILDTGELRCWGDNCDGQLGQGTTDTIGDTAGESTVAWTSGARRALSRSGTAFTCAVTEAGAALLGQDGWRASWAGAAPSPTAGTLARSRACCRPSTWAG